MAELSGCVFAGYRLAVKYILDPLEAR